MSDADAASALIRHLRETRQALHRPYLGDPDRGCSTCGYEARLRAGAGPVPPSERYPLRHRPSPRHVSEPGAGVDWRRDLDADDAAMRAAVSRLWAEDWDSSEDDIFDADRKDDHG